MSHATDDSTPVGDELARALNPRQSRKIRFDPRDADSRALVVETDACRVLASGVPGHDCWGVWLREGVYCDDRAVDVGTLATLLARGDVDVVDFDEVGGAARGVLMRRCSE